MAFEGFGKNSGPSIPPKAQTQFGNFPRPPSTLIPFNNSAALQRSPRLGTRADFLFDNGVPEAPQRVRSPPLAFGSNPSVDGLSYPPTVSPPRWGNHPELLVNDSNSQTHPRPSPVAPYVASRNARTSIPAKPANFQGSKRTRSPPLPSTNEILLRNTTQDVAGRATVSPPRWGNHPKLLVNDSNSQTHQRPSPVAPYVASRNAGTSIPAKPANFQGPKRTGSPPLPSANEILLKNSTQDVTGRLGTRTDLLFDNRGPVDPQRTRSPPLAFESNHFIEDLHRFEEAQRPALSPSRWGNWQRSPSDDDNSLVNQGFSPVAPYYGSHDGVMRLPTKLANDQVPKGTRSPPLPSADEVLLRNSHPPQDDPNRPSVSPPRLGNRSNLLANNGNTQTQKRSSPFAPDINGEGARTKPIGSQVPKRTRSPPLPSADEVFPGNFHSTQDDTEREMQAKAKRLARFNVELSQPVESTHDVTKHKFLGNRHDRALVERQKYVAEHPIEAGGDFMLSDYEGLESSSVIIGLCPDMCPESEREERERKGDLDKYERLDGDRNQTSKSLAVKKYNRTAEREADLIRPMPVLQKTVDYLLALLDQPYDHSFLSMYNFLWDRMRAIRMDLRMQHIFNQHSITMMEQMIRLHIIAMHEFCEYTKGEGFSEGFDAHLNIEQMNKTSVELFQMYDDHTKKGRSVPSEKEFRGYYALLKLDKHPGYKVEPAELSLDLSKMTPEIRQTPEILFARDVARACRTGNFIAFFRLARKATYLQACLMHAHFAKLRTQALASLHSGLQSNQGIPIAHVTKWLGMEEEDIQSLLEYHGFLIKEFEELYMVKEGQFLSSDKDYPTKCSKLVHVKKSRRIIEDVSSSDQMVSWPAEEAKQVVSDKIDKLDPKAVQFVETKTLVDAIDEKMLDFEEDSTPIDGSQAQQMLEIPSTTGHRGGSDCQVAEMCFVPWEAPSIHHSLQSTSAKVGRVGKATPATIRNDSLERNLRFDVKGMPEQTVTGRALQIERFEGSHFESLVENSAPKRVVIKPQENDETMMVHQEVDYEEAVMVHCENEAAMAKLKLILRIWKRRSSKRRDLREQRQLAANAALSSLSLGPPICQSKVQPSHAGEINIDHVARERHERHGKSWSRLNVSEVVAGMLSERNPDAKCLCWKLLVCSLMHSTGGDRLVHRSQANHLSPWLLSKLMGTRKEHDDELAVSSSGLSIWKKWVTGQFGSLPTCCLSIIKDTEVDKVDGTVAGASAILFLVSESTQWELQKTRLHNLLMSLPSGSRLPLLILSGTCKGEVPNPSLMIVNELGLHYLDKTRISSFSVVFLNGNQPPEHTGFFSDDRLREGLQWLASQSPLQPVLHCVKTRELVMSHLNSSLEVLEKMNVSVVGPNHCISAFNEALDRSAEEVATAAVTNPACWPCPEIDLLEESCGERRAAEAFLPNVGWSSAAIINPTISTIKGCALPFFPDDLSWLNHGSDMGKEIQNQKLELEKCMIRYLVYSSKMMEWELATREACVMLQKGAGLELHISNYRIVPRWVMIFRRVFNWQLMKLTNGIFSVAYVLDRLGESCVEQCNMDIPLKFGIREFNTGVNSPTLKGLDNMRLEGDRSPPYALTEPSLDEMVEVCCSSLQFEGEQSEPEAVQPLSGTVDEGNAPLEVPTANDYMEDDTNLQQESVFTETGDAYLSGNCYSSGRSVVVAIKGKKEADSLSKLLEQCNMLQDRIGEKLAIYF